MVRLDEEDGNEGEGVDLEDEDEDDDDEEWMRAIEEGDLDEEDLKFKPKTHAPTARQRTKLLREAGEEIIEDATEPVPAELADRKKKVMTEEMLLKKSEIARRRKNQAIKKLEDTRAATIQRLLQKQTSKRIKKEEEKMVCFHGALELSFKSRLNFFCDPGPKASGCRSSESYSLCS